MKITEKAFLYLLILLSIQLFTLFSMDTDSSGPVLIQGPLEELLDTTSTTLTKKPTRSEPKTPVFVDVCAHLLNNYREYKEAGEFKGTAVLTAETIKDVLAKFFQNFNAKGCFSHWIDFDLPFTPYQEYKYPYVQKIIATPGSKFCFIGDLHGSVHSLIRNLWRLIALGYLDKHLKIIKPNFYMIFLGDYVDRGRYSTETIYLLLKLKNKNWEFVHLVRGNHETKVQNERSVGEGGGFFHELQKKYPSDADAIFKELLIFYQRLPLALYVSVNNNIFKCVHGGFAPYGYYFDEKVKILMKSDSKFYRYITLQENDQANPGYQWCDFEQNHKPSGAEHFSSDVDRVWTVGESDAEFLLKEIGICALFRGHQHLQYGLKMLFSKQQLTTHTEPIVENSHGLYHWITVLHTIDAPLLKEHGSNPNGFAIGNFLPIFTFASAPEGVGSEYDCFGILTTTSNPIEEWRLKVYEHGFPVKTNIPNSAFFLTIKKKTSKYDGAMPLGTGYGNNPIAEFYNDKTPPTLEKLYHNLLEI